jgi:hypothetical protein
MTSITNVHRLPQSIVAAVTNDPYTGGGDISATKLIDSPRVRILTAINRDRITTDVSERVWTLLGQAVHTILERAGVREGSALVEERLFAEMCGWQVSGQFDVLSVDEKKLSDYKVTTTFKKNGSDSWTQQLNVLRWLAHKNGYTVDTLEIVAIFRDWRKTEAQRNPDYPQAAIGVISVPVWPLDEAEQYVRERVMLHQEASEGVEHICSDEERWYSGDSWAAMKPGGKRAVKVFDHAPSFEEVPSGCEVVVRKGEYKRCAHYCDVSAFCSQWAETQEWEGYIAKVEV